MTIAECTAPGQINCNTTVSESKDAGSLRARDSMTDTGTGLGSRKSQQK